MDSAEKPSSSDNELDIKSPGGSNSDDAADSPPADGASIYKKVKLNSESQQKRKHHSDQDKKHKDRHESREHRHKHESRSESKKGMFAAG